jgi:hypothetical protein
LTPTELIDSVHLIRYSFRMATQFSNHVLEAMGYRALSQTESIAARFHCLHVYEVRGFTLEEASLPIHSGTIAGRQYRMALGASVNAVSRALVGDDLSENEQEWQKEHKCTPPYMVVHFGPTREHRFAGTHCRFDDSVIHTYDGFTQARLELQTWAEEVLPSLSAGLASSFTLYETLVKFLPIDRAFYGLTGEGQTVIDTRLQFSATGYVSSLLLADEAAERIVSAINIATEMKEKVARFFHLALNEDDPLKRFLYFFLAVEIDTHATFATIDHAQHILNIVLPPPRAAATSKAFFNGQREKWTNLRDRFVWCVLCTWTHLSDADVEDFVRLKKIRDDIAHGSLATPPTAEVMAVEKLAAKLQLLPPVLGAP